MNDYAAPAGASAADPTNLLFYPPPLAETPLSLLFDYTLATPKQIVAHQEMISRLSIIKANEGTRLFVEEVKKLAAKEFGLECFFRIYEERL
jgi:hypothetical protein